MQKLFGELCSGTVFAHDLETIEHAARRDSSLNAKTMDKRMGMPYSREGSTEADRIMRTAMDRVDILWTSSAHHRVPDDKDRNFKRRRITPPSTVVGHVEALYGAGQTTGHLSRLKYTKQSFEGYRQRSKIAAKLMTRNGTIPILTRMSSAPEQVPSTTTAVSAAGLPRGTQAEPIELSDGDCSSTTDGESDDDAGGFLLDAMPEPDSLPQTVNGIQSEETQLSLSDAAFESQSSRHGADGE